MDTPDMMPVLYLCLWPVAADIIKSIFGIRPANDCAVQDVGFLRRRGVDVVYVVPATGHGRVGIRG